MTLPANRSQSPLRTILRGLMVLLVFVLTFLITAILVLAISVNIQVEMGYDLFPWGPNPTPDHLSKALFWVKIIIPLGPASFLGWKVWTRGRR